MAMVVPDHIITLQGRRRRREKSMISVTTEEREFSVGKTLAKISTVCLYLYRLFSCSLRYFVGTITKSLKVLPLDPDQYVDISSKG